MLGFFLFGGGGWARSVVRLPNVKGKNIIALLPTKPAEVWSENHTNPKKQKQNICWK